MIDLLLMLIHFFNDSNLKGSDCQEGKKQWGKKSFFTHSPSMSCSLRSKKKTSCRKKIDFERSSK